MRVESCWIINVTQTAAFITTDRLQPTDSTGRVGGEGHRRFVNKKRRHYYVVTGPSHAWSVGHVTSQSFCSWPADHKNSTEKEFFCIESIFYIDQEFPTGEENSHGNFMA